MSPDKNFTIRFGIAVAVLVLLLWLSSQLVLLKSFTSLEENSVKKNVQVVLNSLADDLSNINAIAVHFATAGDSYAFIQDANPHYIKNNLNAFTFLHQRLNLILFANSSGTIVFSRGFEPEERKLLPGIEGLSEHLQNSNLLLNYYKKKKSLTGILALPKGPMLIASHPILDGEGNGPIKGMLLMGRYLTPSEIALMSKKTHLDISFQPFRDSQVLPKLEHSLHSSNGSHQIIVEPSGDESISGFTLIRDIYNKPAYVVQVTRNRDISRYGRKTIHFFMLLITGITLAFGLAVKAVFHKLLISRQAHTESENRYCTILEQAAEGIILIDPETGRFVQSNGAFQNLLGYTAEQLGEITLNDITVQHPDSVAALMQRVVKERLPFTGEQYYKCRDTSNCNVELCANLVSYDGKEVICIIAHDITERKKAEDALRKANEQLEARITQRTVELTQLNRDLSIEISERKQAEKALLESQKRNRTIIESTIEGICILDAEGKTVFLNDQITMMLGYATEELIGKSLTDYMNIEEQIIALDKFENLRQGNKERYDAKFRRKDGTDLWVIVSGNPIYDENGNFTGTLNIITDVTERKKLEDHLRESQKMQGIGQLAGGIAHEFNNILTIILGYANLTSNQLDKNDASYDYIKSIITASTRAADITHGLLAYSRKQIMIKKPVNINEKLSNTVKILSSLIGEEIVIQAKLTEAPLSTLADSEQIERVFLILASNARDALQDKGGVLNISSGIITVEADNRIRYGFKQPGKYARITFTDTGAGMNETTKSRIFEPFFTTKEVGKGTGLGLSIAYGILDKHDGYIRCTSQPDQGTTFEIYLPMISMPEKVEGAVTCESVNDVSARDKEVIFIAEDDPELRDLIGTG
jgi:PAS domain S-box-containing protein